MNERKLEYWVLIESGSSAEWGLLNHCAAMGGNHTTVAALVREGIETTKAFYYGAEKVFLLQGKADERQAAEQIAHLAQAVHPEAILYTADHHGRMIAATVAALLQTGLAADCTEISRREDGLLIMTRPTFGGSLLADILCPVRRPQMATVRPGIYLPEKSFYINGSIQYVEAPKDAADAILLERIVSEVQKLTLARIIVAGGKGVGSREGFQLLEQLAASIGAAVGASRAAVNAGFAPYQQQVGLTGQTVRPDLYLAFGISGSVQHLVGMENAKTIISINQDRHAPVFEYSDYGIVGDWQKIAEALLRQFANQNCSSAGAN